MTFKVLPENEQPSDDFVVGYDEDSKRYAAVRGANEPCPFAIQGNSKDLVVGEAVWLFHQYLEAQPEIRPIPNWDDTTKKVVWQ
jgi:hypothetical protein